MSEAPDSWHSTPYWMDKETHGEEFQRKMQESNERVQKIHGQCRKTGEDSKQKRQPPTTAYTDAIRSRIESAKAVSQFASCSIQPDSQTNARISNTAPGSSRFDAENVPGFIGHLVVPAPSANTASDTRLIRTANSSLGIPGQVHDGLEEGEYPITPAGSSTHAELLKDPERLQRMSVKNRNATGDLDLEDEMDIQGASTQQADHASDGPKAASNGGCSEVTSSEDESFSDEASNSDGWPPKPPVCRFKRLVQFSGSFTPRSAEEGRFSALLQASKVQATKSVKKKKIIEADFSDQTVFWINGFFKMDIQLKSQLDQGYSVVMLFMMDGIYPNKVPWRKIDWDLQYSRAQMQNFGILEEVWADVNMDKARGFRVGDTALRVENLPESEFRHKLEFLRLMKRWFDSRIQNSSSFDPIGRRDEIIKSCHLWGFKVIFPTWFIMEQDETETKRLIGRKSTFNTATYTRMPEFKRLIWFLGSPEHQGM